ncbi:MAG: sugar transferase [Patescibacteria group bacterium]
MAILKIGYKLFILLLGLLFLPLGVLIALLILLTSGRPIFYRQRRIGKNGKQFVLYKFRTMKVGADKIQPSLAHLNEADGPVFKIRNDPRYTPLGRFLSHLGLDELPQLINILRGEMALVGPRPLPVVEAKKLKSWMREREQILPGIISPAVVSGRYHQDFVSWMKSDLAYLSQKRFWYDTVLVLRTSRLLLKVFYQKTMESLSHRV